MWKKNNENDTKGLFSNCEETFKDISNPLNVHPNALLKKKHPPIYLQLVPSLQVYLDFADGVNDIVADHYTKSNVWELKKTWAERNDKKYDCCNETYADLTFYMRIARRRSYYSYMLVLPAIVMALLVPLVFLMPIGRPEKFHMGQSLTQRLSFLRQPCVFVSMHAVKLKVPERRFKKSRKCCMQVCVRWNCHMYLHGSKADKNAGEREPI